VLSAACERLQPEAVLLLLDAGADTDAEGPGGLSPLCTAVHAACTEEHLPDKARVLELLLDEGASTAGSLHACAGASADAHGPVCARLLLARDPALLNRCVAGLEDGVTPMMVAARAKSVPMVQLLLEAGAGARARDADGVSVLSYAFYAPQGDDGRRVPQRTREVLGMLLRAGADPLVTDRVGWTVLMRCVSVRVTGFGDDAVNVLLGVLLEAASRASVPHNGILRDKTWKRYQ
jgi:ankyrin repeat protein